MTSCSYIILYFNEKGLAKLTIGLAKGEEKSKIKELQLKKKNGELRSRDC